MQCSALVIADQHDFVHCTRTQRSVRVEAGAGPGQSTGLPCPLQTTVLSSTDSVSDRGCKSRSTWPFLVSVHVRALLIPLHCIIIYFYDYDHDD